MFLRKPCWAVLCVLLFACTTFGCKDSEGGEGGNDDDKDTPLSITITPQRHQLSFGEELELHVVVEGEHADDATIAWDASPDVGTFSSTSGTHVRWTAPDESHSVSLRATATYKDDSATASAAIDVQALAVNIEAERTRVATGESIVLEAILSGADAADATFAWDASEGTLDRSDAQSAVWTAPDDAVTATLSVYVEADGHEADATLELEVQDDACGDEADCTVIKTLDELQAMESGANHLYLLGADIDASETSSWNSGEGFVPIGSASDPFEGTFDGQGYTISNLVAERPDSRSTGIFGTIGSGGHVKNVHLEHARVEGKTNAGIVASINWGQIDDVVIEDGEVTGDAAAGAIVGLNTGTVNNAEVQADVHGGKHVGGFVGENNGTLSDLNGSVSVHGEHAVGGVAGLNAQAADEEGDANNAARIEHVVLNVEAIVSQRHAGGIAGVNGVSAVESDPDSTAKHGQLRDVRVDLNGEIAIENGSAGGIVGNHVRGEVEGASVYALGIGALIKTRNTPAADERTMMGGLVGSSLDDVRTSFVVTDNAFFIGDDRTSTQDSVGGGLIGNLGAGMLSDSYAHLRTNPQTTISGGGVGRMITGGDGGLARCYVEQSFEAVLNNVDVAGGLVGESNNPDAAGYSYWNKQSSELEDSDGGTGLVNAQMNSTSSYSTWDFNAMWQMREDRPDLQDNPRD